MIKIERKSGKNIQIMQGKTVFVAKSHVTITEQIAQFDTDMGRVSLSPPYIITDVAE